MANTIMTISTLAVLALSVDYIDTHVPNGLWYWIDLHLPF